jgi:hypothetical protein
MKTSHLLMIGLSLGSSILAACTDSGPVITDNGNIVDPKGDTSGGDSNNTFDHDNSGLSPFELLDRLQKVGPPKYTSRVHSCPKVKYRTLGNILASRGVDINAAGAVSAGGLYKAGNNALGVADYANRIRENITLSTSAASREFDIFAAAAPEIIAAMPNIADCKVGNVPAELFNPSNQCLPSGITCLTGVPPTPDVIQLCNFTVTSASSVAVGKNMAVAVLMAAAHTCE